MRWEAVLAACGLVAVFVASAAPASAHTQFSMSGYAYDGSLVYNISLSRTFDGYPDCPNPMPGPEGEIGCMKWRVDWIRPFSYGFPFLVDGHLFLGGDNWVPPEVNAGHVGEYEGVTLDPSVDFHIEGHQISEFVFATGHYEQYDLVLFPFATPV